MGVGENHTCAITEGGEAECGTHGLGSVFSRALTVMNPPDPPPGRHYTAISLGRRLRLRSNRFRRGGLLGGC